MNRTFLPLSLLLVLIYSASAQVPILSNPNGEERVKAIGQITDQSVLAKITLEDRDVRVQEASFARLTDPTLVVKSLTDIRLPLYIKHLAVVKLAGAKVDFTKLVGHLNNFSSDTVESMARMQRAIADPIIAGRMPNVTLVSTVEMVYAPIRAEISQANTSLLHYSMAHPP